jgi:hypothetical protein
MRSLDREGEYGGEKENLKRKRAGMGWGGGMY